MPRMAIALGGAAGALARHGVSIAMAAEPTSWPWGTLLVNVIGSWTLGLLMRTLPASTVRPAVRTGLTVGFCGGFTTFSTFSLEAVALARLGQVWPAATYVAISLCLGIAGVVAGMKAGSLLMERRRG